MYCVFRMHTLAVTRDTGEVFSFGMSTGGQLGARLKDHVSSSLLLLQTNWNISPPPDQFSNLPSPFHVSHSQTFISSGQSLLDMDNEELGTSVDPPSPDAMDVDKCEATVTLMETEESSKPLNIGSDVMQVSSGLGEVDLTRDVVLNPIQQVELCQASEQSGSAGSSNLVAMTMALDKPDLVHTSDELVAIETVDTSSVQSANMFDGSEEVTVLRRVYAGGDQSFACVTRVRSFTIYGIITMYGNE